MIGAHPTTSLLTIRRIELLADDEGWTWMARYYATPHGTVAAGAEEVTFVADQGNWRIGDHVVVNIGPVTLAGVAAEWGMADGLDG